MTPYANPQLIDPWVHTVPSSFGRVRVLFWVSVVGSRVVKNEDVLSPIDSSPVLATLNLVVPEAEADRISPLFV